MAENNNAEQFLKNEFNDFKTMIVIDDDMKSELENILLDKKLIDKINDGSFDKLYSPYIILWLFRMGDMENIKRVLKYVQNTDICLYDVDTRKDVVDFLQAEN